MPKRNKQNKLRPWEVRLVKAMLNRGGHNDQDILAYFTRPGRTINHARIKEIRDGTKHTSVRTASEEELDAYLFAWPLVNWDSGLHLVEDELLVKAREAMLLAVQCYNNPKTWFRSEVFIVLSIIAWTYLLHAYYKKIGIDYRHKVRGTVQKTKQGEDKYWELGECLKNDKCPLEKGVKNNLEYLLDIRHEIEHRMTTRIDDFISAKLHACCLNFNKTIQKLFDKRLGFDKDLSFALQFAAFNTDQKKTLFQAEGLPAHINAAHVRFEDRLSEDEAGDAAYTYRVLFSPVTANRKGKADAVIEFVKPGSEEAKAISKIMLKEIERAKFKPQQIVELMRQEGFRKFNMTHFVNFWKSVDGKNTARGFGVQLGDGSWYWYEHFVEHVRVHCQAEATKYS